MDCDAINFCYNYINSLHANNISRISHFASTYFFKYNQKYKECRPVHSFVDYEIIHFHRLMKSERDDAGICYL